jgi:hypothetical protein
MKQRNQYKNTKAKIKKTQDVQAQSINNFL